MKNRLPKGILSAAIVAARVICHGQSNVYSVSIPSFAERHGLTSSHPAQRTLPAPHEADEIIVASYSHGVGSASSCTEWYVSTNSLAKQPRWDGFSTEAPLSVRKACTLALRKISARYPEIGSWTVESVSLRNPYPAQSCPYPDVWCYEITLVPRDSELRKRFEEDATTCPMQVVLLDGTVLPATGTKSE
jgi:hypothetical protein